LNDETSRLLDVGCLPDFSPSGIVRLAQSLGLCFDPASEMPQEIHRAAPRCGLRIADDECAHALLNRSDRSQWQL